jgi:hypothetical protein
VQFFWFLDPFLHLLVGFISMPEAHVCVVAPLGHHCIALISMVGCSFHILYTTTREERKSGQSELLPFSHVFTNTKMEITWPE